MNMILANQLNALLAGRNRLNESLQEYADVLQNFLAIDTTALSSAELSRYVRIATASDFDHVARSASAIDKLSRSIDAEFGDAAWPKFQKELTAEA